MINDRSVVVTEENSNFRILEDWFNSKKFWNTDVINQRSWEIINKPNQNSGNQTEEDIKVSSNKNNSSASFDEYSSRVSQGKDKEPIDGYRENNLKGALHQMLSDMGMDKSSLRLSGDLNLEYESATDSVLSVDRSNLE